MTRIRESIAARGVCVRQALRDESGSTMVEFAITLVIFLFIFFGLLDFGRLAYSYVMAEKAMQRAARIAAVRPPACTLLDGTALPNSNLRNPSYSHAPPPKFGSSCSKTDASGNSVCLPTTVSCTGDALNAISTVWDEEIWPAIAGLLPSNAGKENIKLSYTFDENIGFLGGPYTPLVTTELEGLDFQFVHPLGEFAALLGATGSDPDNDITYPPMSVSLPGEDLAVGNSG